MLSTEHTAEAIWRGLDLELMARFEIDTKRARNSDFLMVPYFRAGRIAGYCLRKFGATGMQGPSGAPDFLWNIDALADDTLKHYPPIICSDEITALATIQAGHPRTAAVPNAGDGPAGFSYLDEVIPLLRDAPEIILAFDGDAAGADLLQDVSLRLGKAKCKWLVYPSTKDLKTKLVNLGDVLRVYGKKGVDECLRRAQWVEVDGVYRMSDLPPMPVKEAHSLGYGPDFKDRFQARRGDLWVVTGLPGHGKSALMDDVLSRLAVPHSWSVWDDATNTKHEGTAEWKVAIASFERTPQTDHRRYLRRWRVAWAREEGRPYHDPEVPSDRPWTAEEVLEADQWIDDAFVFIRGNDETDVTLDWVIDRISAAVIRFNCQVAVLDPWNEIDHTRVGDQSLTEYVGEAIKKLKRLARHLNILLVLVAHPAKLKHNEDVTLYSISDSAHFFNKCDLGLIVERGPKEGGFLSTITVAKARYEDIGRAGRVDMEFSPTARTFRPILSSFKK